MLARPYRTLSLMVIGCVSGCLGKIVEPGPSNGAGGGNGVGPTSTKSTACKVTTTPRRVWMLSRKEYDNTVSTLLGDTSNSAETSFPPEDRTNGYVSNASALSVDTNFMNQIVTAAETIAANRASAIAATITSCKLSTSPSATTQDACAVTFIDSLGAQMYRRPLLTAEVSDLYSAYYTGFTNPYPSTSASVSGVELVITSMLESPQFLYRTELGDPSDTTSATLSLTQYEIATALAYVTTGNPPDATLAGLASSAGLSSSAAILAQYERLAATPAGHARIEDFFLQWLGADDITQAGQASSALTPAIANDMLTESQLFVDDVMTNGGGTLKEILTADYTFVNAELAAYYGITPVDSSANFQKVSGNDAKQKVGILSQGSWLATSASGGVPILHRGHLLREKLYCQQLPSVASLGLPGFTPPPLQAAKTGQTTRDVLDTMIQPSTPCYGCHQYFMTIGFGLDKFDPLGRFQATENGGALDESGYVAESTSVDPATGLILAAANPADTQFTDYAGFVKTLVDDPVVASCFSQQMLTFASGRADVANDECGIADVQKSFEAAGTSVPAGFSQYIQSSAFTQRAR